MHNSENREEELVKTVSADPEKTASTRADDVRSDPALADNVGSDWTDEGGATPAGPATTVDEP